MIYDKFCTSNMQVVCTLLDFAQGCDNSSIEPPDWSCRLYRLVLWSIDLASARRCKGDRPVLVETSTSR